MYKIKVILYKTRKNRVGEKMLGGMRVECRWDVFDYICFCN